MVGDRYGVAESADDSRKTALDVLAANPDLGGFLTFGSQGPIGAGRALDEQKLGDKVVLVGSFSPSQGSAMLKSGIIDGGFMWNPLEAGKVFVTIADYLVGGGKITDGMTIEGLGVVHPDFKNGTDHRRRGAADHGRHGRRSGRAGSLGPVQETARRGCALAHRGGLLHSSTRAPKDDDRFRHRAGRYPRRFCR